MFVGAALLAACGDDGGHPTDAGIDTSPDAAFCTSKTIFLNRAGGTYNAGDADDATTNTTRVLESGSFNVSPYPYGDADWGTIKACVRAAFDPFGVTVTDVDPGTAPHHEVVFTTSYAVWPFPNNPNASSVSSVNCSGVGAGLPVNGVAFVFTSIFGTSRPDLDCADAISQLSTEISGLDHALDCEDFLGNSQPACGPKQFLDRDVQCGETTPRTCQCGGTTQNSYKAMLALYCL